MRLIDADELKLCYTGSDTNKASYLSIRKMIDTSKTTYDIDKVLKQLEEQSADAEKDMQLSDSCSEASYYAGMWQAYEKAIEIVKQGGVSDDVCEWESVSNGEFIQNPHTKRLYSNEPSMQNVYCNTCGKRIKVVEQWRD